MICVPEIYCSMSIILIIRSSHAKSYVYHNTHLQDMHLRVLGGRDVTPGEYSFAIILIDLFELSNGIRICTGVMITENWGLTAAHCVDLDKYYSVWFENFTESPFVTDLYADVLEIFLHPSYRCLATDGGRKDTLVNNDISLFRSKKVNLTSYGRLSSVDHTSLIGLPVTYVGGGVTTKMPLKEDMYKPLQVGEGAIITCSPEMRSISKYTICIAPKCSSRLQKPWYGDSGGPLIVDGMIVGICSFGVESGVVSHASYAPISPYIEWIYDVMHTNRYKSIKVKRPWS